jgi:hypothetical protein
MEFPLQNPYDLCIYKTKFPLPFIKATKHKTFGRKTPAKASKNSQALSPCEKDADPQTYTITARVLNALTL